MRRILRALARVQASRSGLFLLAAILVTAASLPPILRLRFNSDLTALLPETMPSVRDLGEITRRFGAPQTFTLLVTSSDPQANRRFVKALAPQLAALSGSVLSVDWNIGDYGVFVHRNMLLFADLPELVELRDTLLARIDEAKARANPFFADLDSAPKASVESVVDRVRARHHVDERQEQKLGDGYFETADRRSLSVFLRTNIRGGGSTEMEALIASVNGIVARADPHGYAPDMTVEHGGGVMDMYEEKRALESAALLATLVTLGLVAAAIVVFFRRWRAVPILLLGIVPPIALTFALARFGVDYLNASSAFLSAIVIGNGINPHIIWLARYFEARRAGRDPDASIAEAHVATWPGTLSASLAAALAYASLTLTNFRAFRDFGIIGGIGMVLCWFATFLWTPVLALYVERLWPLRADAHPADGNLAGRLVERLGLGRPRLVAAIAAVLSVGCGAAVVRWAQSDPIEYDFRNLESQSSNSPLQVINRRIGSSVDETTFGSAIAVLTGSRADTPHVVAQLEAARLRDPDAFGAVRTIFDLLPADQAEKLPLVAEIRAAMLRVRPLLDETEVKKLDRYLPPADLRVVTEADLPETVARPFIERDGARGSIAYVEHKVGQNQFDGRYLVAWAGAARAPTNLDGSRVAVAGAAPVVADLVQAIVHDGPRTVLASFLATFALLFFTFRRARDRAFTIGSHLLGVLWMVGSMAAFGVKINFLNFVALPVTFGLGVDYGVNVMRRVVEEEGRHVPPLEAVRSSILQTGGAVTLCSMTTLIGYISLYTSPNRAVNSFGVAMSLSEVTCLASAVLVLPAALVLVLRRSKAGGARQPTIPLSDGKAPLRAANEVARDAASAP